jgi:hypothetical protein
MGVKMKLLDINDNRTYVLEIPIAEMRFLQWALVVYCESLEARSQNTARTNHMEYLQWLAVMPDAGFGQALGGVGVLCRGDGRPKELIETYTLPQRSAKAECDGIISFGTCHTLAFFLRQEIV